MQSENVMYYVENLPSTNQQLDTFEAHFIAEMERENPLKIAVQLKAMEELVKRLRANENVRDYIMNEVDKYDEKTFESNGAKFEKAETGVKYDYSKCNDTKVSQLLKAKSTIDKQLKERQKLLQTIKEPIADPETGEIINPALRMSNTYVKVTLK